MYRYGCSKGLMTSDVIPRRREWEGKSKGECIADVSHVTVVVIIIIKLHRLPECDDDVSVDEAFDRVTVEGRYSRQSHTNSKNRNRRKTTASNTENSNIHNCNIDCNKRVLEENRKENKCRTGSRVQLTENTFKTCQHQEKTLKLTTKVY